jgi:hypothetical protein
MGFEQTLGRDWFKNKPYIDFAWGGMDDKAYFEAALPRAAARNANPDADSAGPWALTSPTPPRST